jgi:cyanate permease
VVWLTGRIHDQTGSYHNAFFVFAALAVVASLVIAPVQLKPSRQVRQTSGFDAKIPI